MYVKKGSTEENNTDIKNDLFWKLDSYFDFLSLFFCTKMPQASSLYVKTYLAVNLILIKNILCIRPECCVGV